MGATSKPFESERIADRGALYPVYLLALGLAGGLAFYWACVRDGALYRSDAGWSLAVVIATGVVAGSPSGIKRWLWALLPLTAAVMLDVRTLSAAQAALSRPTQAAIAKYALVSGQFLLLIFVWIVLLPDADHLSRTSTKLRRSCQSISFLIGLAFMSLETYRAFYFLLHSNITSTARLGEFQGALSRTLLGLFALFMIRSVLPEFVYILAKRTNSAPPPISSTPR